ncbi:MAG: M14 family metallopeptidase [Ignavibacteriales bacterium]|nr:MAG: M14 family metallopeptidase [Ignavibacteriales bacterium]
MKSTTKNIAANIPDEWITHYEKSGFTESPRYKETIHYFNNFAEKTNLAKIVTVGSSTQGRKIKCMVLSSGKEFNPQKAKESGKAIVLIQNGIHAGEIEGKDASMLLLREILITKEKEYLLDNLILLVIPIFNVDGHERISIHNRPNQNGPKEMGWRTTAWNLNLNRDYMKSDSLEMEEYLKFFNNWLPDFVIDTHCTNGADYQYHLTYVVEKHANIHPALAAWGKNSFLPGVIPKVEKDGFLTAPYVELKGKKITDGIVDWAAAPRLSTGYSALQNRLALLVETHSLKPFENRVGSTKSILGHTLDYLNQNSSQLVKINQDADNETIETYALKKTPFPVSFKGTSDYVPFIFKGYKFTEDESEITGSSVIRYTNKPEDFEIPFYNKVEIEKTVRLPYAYLIPQEFKSIIDRMRFHRIKSTRFFATKQAKVERYRFKNISFAPFSYEGRQMVDFDIQPFTEVVEIQEGTFIIYPNQRTLRILVNLLEPAAPDSFVRWGFFNAFFERKEYAEEYVLEPFAQEMLKKEEKVRNEFFKKLNENENFRNDPKERLDFFYKRSPFFDRGEKVYPIMRVISKKDLI